MTGTVEGRVVVVTGAASPLGRTLARRFAECGATVVQTDRPPDGRDGAGSVEGGTGTSMAYLQLDARDPDQSVAVVDRVVAEHGRVDIWINNHGFARTAAAASLLSADWEESLAGTVSASFYCSQAVGRQMLHQGSGVIVNVASVDAFQVTAGRVAQSVAGAGLVTLTQALGVEWAPLGVRVVGVAPGVLDAVPAAVLAARGSSMRRIPMGRPGGLAEVAEAVLFLASADATYIVGETLRVDGGWSAYQLF